VRTERKVPRPIRRDLHPRLFALLGRLETAGRPINVLSWNERRVIATHISAGGIRSSGGSGRPSSTSGRCRTNRS
jgi:hypothetical protein